MGWPVDAEEAPRSGAGGGGVTGRKASPRTAAKEVGQLRYAAVDAFAPLIAGLGVATLEGLPTMAGWVAFAAGSAAAGWRMIAYSGK